MKLKLSIHALLTASLMILMSGIASTAQAEVQGAQCLRLEHAVKRCAGHGSISCKVSQNRFKHSCETKPVCGQPPFKCTGEICAMVMPAPVTYPSVKKLKAARAEFLYFGSCLSRVVSGS